MVDPQTMPVKFPIQKHNVVTNLALTQSGTTIIRDPFPLGEGWYTLLLDFKCALTHGNGTTVKAEALLRVVRDIMLRTDRDDIIVKAPGRSLYKRAQKVLGTAPFMDTFAATTANYSVAIPINFANKRAKRPEDTLLNTGRYRNVELHITLGSLADMLGTPGTDTAVFTVDISVEKTMFAVAETNAPLFLPYIMGLPPVDPNSIQYQDIEKNPDLALLDVMMFTTNTDVIAGIPFSGTAADVIAATVTLYDNVQSCFRNLPWAQLQRDNKTKFAAETMVSGQVIFDFIEDWSMLSGFPTGDKSVLQAQWVNGTPTGGQVTLLLDGVKRLRA